MAARTRALNLTLWPLILGAGMSALHAQSASVAGLTLGVSAAAVARRLGAPDRQATSLGMAFWDYDGRGVTLIWREGAEGLHGIVVRRQEAGPVGGVHVGDDEQAVRAAWGTPARERQGGRFLDFVGAEWVLSVEIDDGRVVEMTLMAASRDQHHQGDEVCA